MKIESMSMAAKALLATLLTLPAVPTALSGESLEGYPCLESTTPLKEGAVEILEPCALHPDLVEMEKRCRVDELDRDRCAWLEAFGQLASGQVAAAEDDLAGAFQLSTPEAGRLRRAAQNWLPLVIDEASCPFESMRPLVEAMMASGVGSEPEATLVRLRLSGFDPAAAEQVLASTADARAAEGETEHVARRSRAIEALVSLVGSNETVQEAVRASVEMPEVSGRASWPALEDWPPDLQPFAGRLEAVDETLATLPRSTESFFAAIEQVVADVSSVEAALVWVRAGIGLTMSGRAEDGALALHRAENLFRRSGELTVMARQVRLYGVIFRVILSRYFQLNREAVRLLDAAREGASLLERGLLENAACAPLSSAEVPMAKRRAARFQQEILRADLAGEISEAERQGLMAATLVALPGLASSTRAPLSPGKPPMPGIPEAMLIGDFARGLERWREVTVESRQAELLLWPALVTAAAVKYGRIGAARRSLELGITHVEEVLAENRSVEISRSMIDQALAPFYGQAVELAMLEEDMEAAFAYAERGRSFALRRQLGAPEAAPGRASEEERELEGLVVASASGAATEDPDELLSRFEAARWRRLLADSPLTPSPSPVSLQALREEALAPGDVLVAYFPGVEKMWVWAISRRQVVAASLPWGPEAEKEVQRAVAALRWSSALVETRSARLFSHATGLAAERLYDKLLGPIAGQLESATRVIVVPHGVLHTLPFAALRTPSGLLIEKYEVSVVPSAGVLAGWFAAPAATVDFPAEEIP